MNEEIKQNEPGGQTYAEPTCSALPCAQVLKFQPELTHSVWVDFEHRKRTVKGLEKVLRDGVLSGEHIGYRLITVHEEYVGATWPNAGIERPMKPQEGRSK